MGRDLVPSRTRVVQLVSVTEQARNGSSEAERMASDDPFLADAFRNSTVSISVAGRASLRRPSCDVIWVR